MSTRRTTHPDWPIFRKIGGQYFYHQDDLDKFLEDKKTKEINRQKGINPNGMVYQNQRKLPNGPIQEAIQRGEPVYLIDREAKSSNNNLEELKLRQNPITPVESMPYFITHDLIEDIYKMTRKMPITSGRLSRISKKHIQDVTVCIDIIIQKRFIEGFAWYIRGVGTVGTPPRLAKSMDQDFEIFRTLESAPIHRFLRKLRKNPPIVGALDPNEVAANLEIPPEDLEDMWDEDDLMPEMETNEPE